MRLSAVRTPPRGAPHLGIDDREVHAGRVGQRAAQHERTRAHVMALDAVRDVEDARSGAMRAMTPWHTPTNSSSWP
jgi:hypothetical protein